MVGTTDIDRSGADGVARQGPLAELVARQHLELLPRLDHHRLSLFVLEVDLSTSGEHRGRAETGGRMSELFAGLRGADAMLGGDNPSP